ncbi:MAG TPA: hemolysin family protein [Methylomirabilota bacterium]|nr:hemolysin family protein [Methylomirabilota bacterium]
MDGIWVELVLIVVAIVANGFFSGSELAVVSARAARLVQLRGEGVKGAQRALDLKAQPETFLATVQIAITLVGTLASAVGGATAVEALTPRLAELPVPLVARWAEPLALGIVIVAVTFASLVIGELTPKALALRNPERIACVVAPVLQGIARLLAGPNRVLTLSTRAVLALLGQRHAPLPAPVSEEEIKILLREGADRGVFEHQEAELVRRIFAFTDTPVRAIMTPRPNIRGLDVSWPPDETMRAAAEHSRSRLPIFRDSIDEPIGFVTIKDLFAVLARGETPTVAGLVRPALYVPEGMPVGTLLREFQRRHTGLALVVDEYGSVVGLITIEDVLEEIVGEVREEYEGPHLPFATRLPDGAFSFDGTASVRDLREQGGIPLEESARYQTLAGFILDRLATVPQPGATLRAAGYLWTVLEMDGPRIVKVKAQPLPG